MTSILHWNYSAEIQCRFIDALRRDKNEGIHPASRSYHHDCYGVRRRQSPGESNPAQRQAQGSSRDTGWRVGNTAVADVARTASETADRSAGRRLAAAIDDATARWARRRISRRRATG